MAGSKKNTSNENQAVAQVALTEKVPVLKKVGGKKSQSVVEPTPVSETVVLNVDAVVGESESKFDTLFKLVQSELKDIKDRQSGLTLTLRKMESAHRAEIKSVRKHKQKRNGLHKPTGFAKPQVVPEKLAKFIGVKGGSELTGPEITSAVWKQLKSRNLTYENDKRVFRTNKEVSALFNVPVTVNTSVDHRDENGFNFCNLQTYIAHALKGTVNTSLTTSVNTSV
jgi:chromatin remodeling complex protein RSC6